MIIASDLIGLAVSGLAVWAVVKVVKMTGALIRELP